MLYLDFSRKLIGLKDIIVKNIIENEKNIEIEIEMEKKSHKCPNCGNETNKIHDYRMQEVKDISAFGKQVILLLKKRRYRCSCGKRFFETNTFLPKYHRMTNRLVAYVLEKLREVVSYTSVAREMNLSVSTVIRIFDLVGYMSPELPEVLSIDEFKGNTGKEKYQCIITDPVNGKVLDILPKRYGYYINSYFRKKERNHVKFFISDMWKTYKDTSDTYFKNATFIVDKYHWIRQVNWAFEAVRKEEQKKFSKTHRIYFKRSKRLLTKRFHKLTDEQKVQVNVMLYTSATLSSAHFLKESFMEIIDSTDIKAKQHQLSNWITDAEQSDIESFVKCSKTMINWFPGIINSLEYPYTNGFTEGCNNKIKVLKRNAYGYKNFKRFRNRILHIFSNKITLKQQREAV